VIGLARAWMVAGVPTVVASLWSVPDAPTSALMVAFYRQLAQGAPTAHALRRAMLAMLAQHPDPVDWAAFTLIGNARQRLSLRPQRIIPRLGLRHGQTSISPVAMGNHTGQPHHARTDTADEYAEVHLHRQARVCHQKYECSLSGP
jgi:hypothetical protein